MGPTDRPHASVPRGCLRQVQSWARVSTTDRKKARLSTPQPSGLAGEAIPLQARVIQIADIFDALTSSRSYRKAFTWEKALDILKEESGIVVDPKLSALFDGLIREWSARDPEGFRSMFDNGQAPPVEPEAGEGTT